MQDFAQIQYHVDDKGLEPTMPVTTANRPTLGVPQRPLRRSNTDYILGGVCGGLAIRLGLRERTLRILFSLGALLYGAGALVYVALWLLVVRSGESQSIAKRLIRPRRQTRVVLFTIVIAFVMALALHAMAQRTAGGFVWILLLCAVGIVAVWRGSSSQERTQLEGLLKSAPVIGGASARGWKAVALRVVPGVVLVIVGLNILNQIGGVWGAAVPALLGAAVLVGGLLVLLAPWWLQNVRDLSNERRERVRAEERAALVTHIHDSVLQTLTLIERAAGREADVVRLARAQERELREWLFNPDAVGSPSTAEGSFAASIAGIERDVERDYGVKVELVTVGDCDVDDRIRALVSAGREAAINAAKWSGAKTVSVYAEVEPERISLFVRDIGLGFDPESVAPNRQGIALSIRHRMAQCGGQATIRSAPGSGTDVQLVLPVVQSRP